jgi:transcriptional regulator of arginine metabolism
MGIRNSRLDVIKEIISSQKITCQEELLDALAQKGYKLTQATLSRDLKQMKVAKATSVVGKSYYVLPNNTMYRRVKDTQVTEARHSDGFVSLRFSGNLAVMKTNPGYASRMAYDIDNANLEHVLGTVAGDDTIMIVFEEGVSKEVVRLELAQVIRM